MGLGSLGGGSQMLFGGSGGQDVFQKATWVMGAIFMIGSLGLALMKKPSSSSLLSSVSAKIEAEQKAQATPVAVPESIPTNTTAQDKTEPAKTQA